MNHPDEESLLKLRLELLEPEEVGELQEHLTLCNSCREQYQSIVNNVEVLEGMSLKPIREHYALPVVKRTSFNYWWKAAAVLTVALTVSYVAMHEHGRRIQVEPMRMTLIPPPDSLQSRLSCTAVDLLWR